LAKLIVSHINLINRYSVNC